MMRGQELTIKNIMTKTKTKTKVNTPFCNVLRNDALQISVNRAILEVIMKNVFHKHYNDVAILLLKFPSLNHFYQSLILSNLCE